MSKHILVVGSINVDYVIQNGRLPKLGETIKGSDFAQNYTNNLNLMKKAYLKHIFVLLYYIAN